MFLPQETEVFVRLLKFGLLALDIYRITVLPSGAYVLRNSKLVEREGRVERGKGKREGERKSRREIERLYDIL